MKKVSVIIPFYRNVEWLCEAVDSVLNQTYKNIEIIVINDGSPENVDAFIKKYGPQIIYHFQENAGPASARNWGIQHASGDYIAFEDSDDVWLPQKLDVQIAFMEERAIMWSHTGYYNWWPLNGKLQKSCNDKEYGYVLEQRRISSYMATPSVVIDREVFKDSSYLFPIESRIGEDDRLYTRIARSYPLGLVQRPLVKVRMRNGNSYTRALPRFNLRYSNYLRWREEGDKLSVGTHIIYSIYGLYVKLLGNSGGKLKEFTAKCLWVIPYSLERLYLRIIFLRKKNDDTFILKQD